MAILAALIALGLAQPAATEPVRAASARKLSDIAGVTVSYYDVPGNSVRDLHDWLDKHGPRDPRTHFATPVRSSWSVGSAARFRKTGGQCMLTGATVKFTATVTLPRLAPGQKLTVAALQRWNSYVAALEDRQAVQLGFVRDRLGEVESAIMRSNCGNWQKAASAAIQRLSEEQAQAFKPDPKTQPKLLEPDKDG